MVGGSGDDDAMCCDISDAVVGFFYLYVYFVLYRSHHMILPCTIAHFVRAALFQDAPKPRVHHQEQQELGG